MQHAITLDGGVPIALEALTAVRDKDDAAPLDHGQVRAKVLRSGYSPADDRPQCYRGQIIRLPRGIAEKAAAAGVLEVLQEEPATRDEQERPAGSSMQHAISASPQPKEGVTKP